MKHSVLPFHHNSLGRCIWRNNFSPCHISYSNSLLSPCFTPSVSLSLLSCPSHSDSLRVKYPDGWTADSPAAGNKGCLARPQSQRRTGKPCGPAPRQSGVGRNPWPLGRTGWHPPPHWSPFGWSHVAVWLRAQRLRKTNLSLANFLYKLHFTAKSKHAA